MEVSKCPHCQKEVGVELTEETAILSPERNKTYRLSLSKVEKCDGCFNPICNGYTKKSLKSSPENKMVVAREVK